MVITRESTPVLSWPPHAHTPPGLTPGFQNGFVCAFGRQLQVKCRDVCAEGVADAPEALTMDPWVGLELW